MPHEMPSNFLAAQTCNIKAMKSRGTITRTFTAALLVASLCGCSLVKKYLGPQGQPGAGGQQGQQGQQTPAGGASVLSGNWQVAFQVGDKTLKANMHVTQNGNQFTGEGVDDPSGREFIVEEGILDNGAVHFFKRYPGADASAAPPIEYTGKMEIVNEGEIRGPYMSGEYATTFQGSPLRGIWEASMTQTDSGAPMPGTEAPPAGGGGSPPPPQQPTVDPNRAPHLSGKWEVGYEYKFKTFKSTMYLEQEGGKLRGHGEDKNTKEKFVIEKGWYNFPRVTIERKYQKGKGAASDRTMTFKAQVSNVNDADYQGPYLSGKTDGGGAWEAQMVK